MNILKTKENISTIALAYLDETDGFLKEVTEKNMYVAIPSFKKGLKRFYLIGDYLYNYSLSVSALVTNPELVVKVLLGRKINTLEIFTPATHIDKVIYQEAEFKYLNAVPLDILIESQSILELTESLIIEIGTEEFTELSCYNATNSSDCISFEGTCDLYIDDVLILTNASEFEIYNYFSTTPNFSTNNCGSEFENHSSLISCAGAERVANIWFNGQSSGAMVNVKIEITNENLTQEYGSFFSPLSSLIDIIKSQTNINFYIGCGGEVFISNEEYTEYRVKITIQDTSIIIGGDSESNPTLLIDQAKGTFEFCLAPYIAM